MRRKAQIGDSSWGTLAVGPASRAWRLKAQAYRRAGQPRLHQSSRQRTVILGILSRLLLEGRHAFIQPGGPLGESS